MGGRLRIYEFGDYLIDAPKRVISTRDGIRVRLTPKVFDTLVYLLEHRDSFSTKDVLMRAIWPDRVVEENNLDQIISALRRALGEKRDNHRYVVTVPGRGYRMVADVKTRAAPIDGVRAAPIASIAVLPFRPIVPSMQDASLDMGMADTLIARLSGIRQITVRPLSSVRKYAGLEQDATEAGRELAVEAVLEGHLQRRNEKVRVSVRLIRVADAATLWAGTFDEKFDDIFELQDAISEHVVDALTLELDGEERSRLTKHNTESTAAYSLYLKGRFFWWKNAPDEFRKSRDYFHQAVDADPTYALGYCGLNSYYGFGAAWGLLPPDEAWPRAEAAIAKALTLDDRLAEAHTGLAALRLVYFRDWAGAERAVRRAIALNPGFDEVHYLYSFYLLVAGRFDEAIAEGKYALAIDPFSPRMNEHLGKCLYFAGRYDEAIRQCQYNLDLAPDSASTHELLGDVHERNGTPSAAVAEWIAAMKLAGDPDLATILADAWERGGISGAIRAVAQNRLARLDLQANAGRYVGAAAFARQHARNGDRAAALHFVEKACDERTVFALLIDRDPAYTALRTDARFGRAIERINPARACQTEP